MSLQKQQDFLARLFTDEGLRQNFWSEPAKIGAENGLSESETADLQAVLPEELGFFADSLFWKRLHEVEKLLPLTCKCLGEDFAKHFRAFSQNFNPQSVKKHLEDAIEFCNYLQKTADNQTLTKDSAKFEQAKLYFYSGMKNPVLIKLGFDFRQILDKSSSRKMISQNEFKRKNTFAIWFRIGKISKQYIF